MMRQTVTVHYLDGHTEPAEITQYDLRVFEDWATRRGLGPSKPGRALVQEMPVTFLRVGAWSALFRGASSKPAFDTWDPTVIEVEVLDTEAPDPTPTDTPDDPSPE